jgi:uncharacterized membrane protein
MFGRKASRRRASVQPGLLKVLDTIRSSFWFIPTIMVVTAVVTGVGVGFLQKRIGWDWHEELDVYQATTLGGARKVLSTIASSAIKVAAVVFSVTTVAVSFAAGETLAVTLPAVFEKG